MPSRKVTIKDVARAAEVSLGTASRVLNEHPAVEEAIRRRVLQAMADLGYEPNSVAQSLRTLSTRTIGFIIPDISNPMWARILSAAVEVCRAHTYSVVVASTGGSRDGEIDALRTFRRRRADAYLLCLNSLKPDEVASLIPAEASVVMMERDLGSNWDTVLTDHRTGAYAAAHHLLTLGHRRIALITATQDIRPGSERVNGYRQAYAEFGVPVPEDLVRCGRFDADFAHLEAAMLLGSASPPTAIIAGGNQLLPGVLRAAAANRLNVPQDLSIVSCGDTDLAQLASPEVTVVRWNVQDVGRAAAEMVARRLGATEPPPAARIVLPTELVVRGSSALRVE